MLSTNVGISNVKAITHDSVLLKAGYKQTIPFIILHLEIYDYGVHKLIHF